jgi:GT2 family glycosyltransferase
MARRASVVLITWNSAIYLPRCIEGLRGQADVELEIIVIDNASSDRSVEIIAGQLPRAILIRNVTNVGFAAAANQGVARSSAKYVLFLNPDAFLTPSYVATLIDAMERDPAAGSATGKLLEARGDDIQPTGFIDSLGIEMLRGGRHVDLRQGEKDEPPEKQTFEVFGVSGAAAMLSRSFIEDVSIDGQLFDERFFAYREDADLAWRGRIAGWKSICVATAVGYHVRRVTPERRSELSAAINMHSVKNRFLLRFNNQESILASPLTPRELMRDIVVIAAVLLRERTSLPALTWLVRNRASIRRQRRLVQAKRRVSDRDLLKWFR